MKEEIILEHDLPANMIYVYVLFDVFTYFHNLDNWLTKYTARDVRRIVLYCKLAYGLELSMYNLIKY